MTPAHNFPRLCLIGLATFLLSGASAWAADCRLDSVVCKEGLASDSHYVAGQTTIMPCKTFAGESACLTDIGQTCWGNRKTYTCIKPNSVNYCQPFIDAQPQCWQTGSRCSQMDTLFDSGCMKHLQTWRCDDPSRPTPSDTLRLSDTYTLVSSDYDPAPCQSLDDSPSCSIAESQCVSTSPDTPLPPGIDPSQAAPDDCYRKQNTYACLTGQTDSSECDGYASNPDCTQQSSTCSDTFGNQCVLEQRTYQCMSRPPQTNTVTDCSGQLFCQNGHCFDTGYTNDTDFAQAMALMEAAREAGVYGEFGDGVSIFSGAESKCRIKLFGLANCCKKSSGGGGYNNNLLFNIAGNVGENVLAYGSRYVYDALYTTDAPNWMIEGMGALVSVDPGKITQTLPDWSPSYSLYGFTVSLGSISPGFIANQLGVGVVQLGSFGGLTFAFDPTSLAIQLAIMVIQELMSCEQEEQILAMRRGQNLCYEIGTYCSKELKLLFIKICMEHKKSYCCYNSRLARLINEQGRAQIGKSWGSPKNPDCSGFSPTEFDAIDFSRINLSEFMAEVMASINMPNLSGVEKNIQGVVQQKLNNYYERGQQ